MGAGTIPMIIVTKIQLIAKVVVNSLCGIIEISIMIDDIHEFGVWISEFPGEES